MDRLKAFLAAVALSVLTAVGIHFYGLSHITFDPHEMGVWTDDAKFLSREGILKNQDDGTMLVFGSSEFETAQDSPYHICRQFQEDTFTPMLIGRGHCQCLQHAVTLASIGNELANRRVVLIVSPQWFQRKSVLKRSYAVRFSESHFVGLLQNDRIPKNLKMKILDRTETLLDGVDNPMLERVELYNRMLLEKKPKGADRLYYGIYKAFNQEKDRLRVVEKAKLCGISQEPEGSCSEGEYDWKTLYGEADRAAREHSDNPFYMNQEFYEENQRKIKKQADKDQGRRFRKKAKEYSDLKLFLEVCSAMEIEPLVIIAPYDGYWMDYTGFPKSVRDKTYRKIKKTAEANGAQVVDLSGEEYEPYFFEDNSHFSGKGWVKFNEAIYRFYKEGRS